MKVTGVSFLNYKNNNQQIRHIFFVPQNQLKADTVSFTSKEKKVNVNLEAKDLTKENKRIFYKAERLVLKGQDYIEESSHIINKSAKIQEKSKEIWGQISEELDYAAKNGVRAYSNDENTQVVFNPSRRGGTLKMTEYKNDGIARKVESDHNRTIYTDFSDRKNVKRMIFDSKSGELTRYDEGFAYISKTEYKTEKSYHYKKGELQKLECGVAKNSKESDAKTVYEFTRQRESQQ